MTVMLDQYGGFKMTFTDFFTPMILLRFLRELLINSFLRVNYHPPEGVCKITWYRFIMYHIALFITTYRILKRFYIYFYFQQRFGQLSVFRLQLVNDGACKQREKENIRKHSISGHDTNSTYHPKIARHIHRCFWYRSKHHHRLSLCDTKFVFLQSIWNKLITSKTRFINE